MARLSSSLTSIFCQLRSPSETSDRWHAAHLPSTCARLVGSDTMHIAARYPANDRPIIDRRAGISSLKTSGNCVYWVAEPGSIARRPLKRPRAIISRRSSSSLSLSLSLKTIDGEAKQPSYRFKPLFGNVRRRRGSLKRGYSHARTSNFSASH